MKSLAVLLAFLSLSAVAVAQEAPGDPYEFILAKLAAEDGRYDEALNRIEKVIEKNPGNPVLLYERAMMLIDAGKVDRAETELRAVTAASPDFYDAQRVLGRLLLDRAGSDRTHVEEALKHLQAAYTLKPDDLSTGVAVSQLLVSMGKTQEAERVLATLVERAPDQRSINYNYAQILTKLGRGDESKQYLERAVLLDPTFGPAILQLIDIYQKESEWEKAADVLQPLIDQDALNVELQRQQAYFYLRAGNAEKARTGFENLIKLDPKDNRALYYLGESLNDLEQYAEAEKVFKKLLATEVRDADLLASYGLTEVGLHNWDEAAKTFTSILSLPDVPDNITALAQTQLANVELQRGNFDAAVTGAKPVFLFRDKPNSQAIGIALEALKRAKKDKDAVALLQPLAEKYPNDAFVNARYVEALVRSGDAAKASQTAAAQAKFGGRNAIATAEAYIAAEQPAAAIALLQQSLKAKPDDLDLIFELGSAQERSGDRKSAEKTFLGILEKQPQHAQTLNYLGYMWAESGVNLDRAQDMLTRAVSQQPRNGAFIDSLGWLYFRQGKLDLAERYLTDATRLLPRDATVHEHLADVLVRRGEGDRALQLYRLALSLDPDPKESETLRTKIAELERQSQTSQR
ncbi:MAG TPA: tetratricopeptide repeat protein [Thermoanaerobaculia bacterium]|nr:tetratricopeptide repeat protein [Thermoanaerobaculia bacterium]